MLWRTSCQRIFFFMCKCLLLEQHSHTKRFEHSRWSRSGSLTRQHTPFPGSQPHSSLPTHAVKRMHTHSRTRCRINAYTHSQTRSQSQCIHTQSNTHPQSTACTLTDTHTEQNKHTHTVIYARTHARTYTYIDEHKLHLFFLLQSHSNKKVMPVLNWFQNIGISKFYNVT